MSLDQRVVRMLDFKDTRGMTLTTRTPAMIRNREQALAALDQARAYLITSPRVSGFDDERELLAQLRAEGERQLHAIQVIIFGLWNDEYLPAKFFKFFASVSRIASWRDDPNIRLDVITRHGRLCVRPSSFLAHWRSMPDERKRRAGGEIPGAEITKPKSDLA